MVLADRNYALSGVDGNSVSIKVLYFVFFQQRRHHLCLSCSNFVPFVCTLHFFNFTLTITFLSIFSACPSFQFSHCVPFIPLVLSPFQRLHFLSISSCRIPNFSILSSLSLSPLINYSLKVTFPLPLSIIPTFPILVLRPVHPFYSLHFLTISSSPSLQYPRLS